ncbi:carbohydrate ABC transporter permease [Microbacterium sp. C5A9]|uniref:carbohydrate ABC transporter permease n=1 Tax=Microbacterium sp. C5A9 TaxID=2736663 RepID=UPI001F52831C|nr:carbohydrate ABC transporter permease [Microbacterium sp. C5A9]MCI1018679.1 carbohydrate ABC transporter permease [Microbacterium sp. C5A9]
MTVDYREARPRHAAAPQPEALGDRIARPRRRAGSEQLVALIGLILFALYSVAPIWWLIVNATKDRRDLYNSNGLWFADFNLWSNLESLATYQDGIFFRWVLNTVLYAGVGAAVCTLISIAVGYSLSKFSYRGRGVGLGIVVGSFLIPSTLITLPLFLLFSQLGIVDTMWAVLIPFFVSPFGAYLAKVYVDGSIPDELLEAARIDGASEWRIFFTIVLPMMRTGAATVFILLFVANWNNFFLPLTMLRGSDKWTLAVGLYSWFVNRSDSVVDLTALTITGALISVIPLAIMMISMQRYWKTGVTLGAIK